MERSSPMFLWITAGVAALLLTACTPADSLPAAGSSLTTASSTVTSSATASSTIPSSTTISSTVSSTTASSTATTLNPKIENSTPEAPESECPPVDKRRLKLSINGEEVSLSFSKATLDSYDEDAVFWHYEGVDKSGQTVSCQVISPDETILSVTCEVPQETGYITEEDVRTFLLSELPKYGLSNPTILSFYAIASKQIRGNSGVVAVELSADDILSCTVRSSGGKLKIAAFSVTGKGGKPMSQRVTWDYLDPEWI